MQAELVGSRWFLRLQPVPARCRLCDLCAPFGLLYRELCWLTIEYIYCLLSVQRF